MVNKTLLKETKNFIKKNLKTYIAQVIIIMLGVGFFVGMKISSLDLQDTMTNFVETNNFYDIKVNLEYGIEEQDIEELKNILKEVKYIEGAYSTDLVNNIEGKDYLIRLHSYNANKNINTIKLKDGKLPTNNQECVIDTKMNKDGFNIGDEITIETDLLHEQKLKIVGVIQSPEYLALERGNSTTLSGKINYYIYVNEDNVNSDVYSELYIKYDTDYQAFTDEYDDYIEKKEIETTYEISGYFKDKYNEIILEQQMRLNEAKAEYELVKATLELEFNEAESEINQKEELVNSAKEGLLTMEEIEEKVKDGITSSTKEAKEELEALKKEMDAAKKEYDNYKNNYNLEVKKINAKILENEQKIKTIDAQISTKTAELNKLKEKYNSSSTTTTSCYPGFTLNSSGKCCYYGGSYCYDPAYGYNGWYGGFPNNSNNTEQEQIKKEIDALELEISNLKVEKNKLEAENVALKESLNFSDQLTIYENKYNELKKEYEAKLEIYKSMGSEDDLLKYYQNQNKELEKIIAEYEKEIKLAKEELATKKEEASKELEKAELEIQNGEDLLNSLTCPNSYVFTRKDNAGYGQFIADIEKISNLAIIVPVVFYFITFFMISASINRMLHEERNQIGTLKALGVSDKTILIKYLIYSISSVIIGSLLGILIGIVILPLLVYFIYEMLYEFPDYSLLFNIKYFSIATIIAFVVALASTLVSCAETFKEKPVLLLKAKQEKETKQTIFEKLPIWDNLSLMSKLSLKNIFRYKTRMLMTVIGIGGCLALMLTGLSLRTSITEMIPTQYGGIFKVDAQIFYKDLSTREELAEGTKEILELDNAEAGMTVNYQTYTSDYDNKSISINVVTFTSDEYLDYIELRDYKTKKILNVSDDGVIISEKLAKMKNIKVGDYIAIKDQQQNEYVLKVSNIAENYIEHYIYMNSSYYQKIFETDPRNNMLLLKITGDYDELALAKEINNTNIVSQILYVSIAEKAYEDIMNNLALLVGVFVVFSVLLVFAVLYNLININIRERSKEIATYKVLGFKTSNVISIVKRENIVLMIIGIIFGLIAGTVLSLIVIQTCEVENLNFIKEITLQNYLISIISTAFFTLLFSMIINKYVKNINLTEALKSNE